MVDPDELIQLLRTQPFEPFTVYMTDGVSLSVRHPDQAMVAGETLYVTHEGRAVRCAAINIMRVAVAEPAS